MDFKKLIRTHLKDFEAYVPGEQPTEGGWVKLNTNENPYPPNPEILTDLKNAADDRLKLYPDPFARVLREKFLNLYLKDFDTVDHIDNIFVGNGTDDVLEVLFKLFIEPGDDVIFFDPSYGMYITLTELYGGNCVEIPLGENFSFPERNFEIKGKLLIINSPNNPTGQSFDNDSIQSACESFPGVVIVDETYADFSDTSVLPLLKQVDNLVVTRSFSKSFSLASLRLGLAIADKNLISLMNRVKLPYNVNYMAQVAGISCIEHKEEVFENNKNILSERKRLKEQLNKYDEISVLPSDSNFILVKFENESCAKLMFEKLKERRILIRYFSKPSLAQFVRISVGTEKQNDKFLSEFDKILDKNL
ncbi:MAG: Histidinol-phosphate aminotransferase [Promethearchaeota archaeon]|nr:MAG: Histidinol-phosphate aminotransferase [Candidatus Lokiarchaeota archaeon]